MSETPNGEATPNFLNEEEKWSLPAEALSLEVLSPDIESPETLSDKKILWTQFVNGATQSKETEAEKQEKDQAIKEQIDAGILKVVKNNQPQTKKSGKVLPSLSKIIQTIPPDKNIQNSNINKKPKKIGPNEPCPCGSGKKYKKCHGRGG